MESDAKGAVLPVIYTQHPVAGASPETLDGYITGADPVTGRRVIDEIIDVLTTPQQPKKTEVTWQAAGSRAVETLGPDTEDNLQHLFYENGWTDGLPVILPTEERVNKMLAGTSAAPDEVVREVYVWDTEETVTCTVKHVAIIAVMAGARPEHLPVILAIASTGQPALMPSTTPFESMVLVNGPIKPFRPSIPMPLLLWIPWWPGNLKKIKVLPPRRILPAISLPILK